jgi:hypothetical protein
MRYIKIVLTIITALLALNTAKSKIPSATATGVVDVNMLNRSKLLQYCTN